jgi:hypothetical protein
VSVKTAVDIGSEGTAKDEGVKKSRLAGLQWPLRTVLLLMCFQPGKRGIHRNNESVTCNFSGSSKTFVLKII